MSPDAVPQFFGALATRGVVLYIIVLFGSIAMYVFQLDKGFEGAVGFLKRLFPGHSDAFYSRLDFLVVSLAGSVLGLIIFQPTTSLQALGAGVGWVGAMNTLLAGKSTRASARSGGQS